MNKNQKGTNNPNYKEGKYVRNKICIECSENRALKNSFYCNKCSHKIRSLRIRGINNPNHKHGNFAEGKKCLDCKKEITVQADRCKSCAYKKRSLESKGKNRHTSGKRDYYKNILMRSSYEIIYAKYLDKNEIKWKYEPKTFDLGKTTYTPDFYLPESDTYVEVKGYWLEDAKKKFKKFKDMYKEKIIVINEEIIKQIKEKKYGNFNVSRN